MLERVRKLLHLRKRMWVLFYTRDGISHIVDIKAHNRLDIIEKLTTDYGAQFGGIYQIGQYIS